MSWLDALRAAYGTILGGGTAVPQRGTVNFAGAGATVTDDPVTKVTTVTITGGSIGPLTPLRSVVSDSGGVAVSGQAITTAATADTLALRDGGGGLAITTLARTYESAPGITDARLYATGNGSTNDFVALQTAAAAQPRLHWSPGAYKVATTGAIGTANSSVHSFEPGAVVHAVAATPCTLHGAIDAADDQQIFIVDAPGAILLPDVAVVHPGWFGAGMGASNDAVALNSSFAACADGATVQLRPVVHKVTAPLLQTTRHNIIGHGPTSIIQVGAGVSGSTDILTIAPPANVVIDGMIHEKFAIVPASGTPGQHGIVIDVTADASGIARHRVSKIFVGQLGGDGIRVVNLPAKADGWFTSSIEQCTLLGGMNLVNSGDSIVLRENVCTGTGIGIEVQPVSLRDRPDSIKTSIATSTSPQTYSGAALNGAIGSTLMIPAEKATVTTSAHAATYNTGSPIVVHGTDASNSPVTDNLTLTMAGGGETIVGTQDFKTITSIVIPAQSTLLGAFTFGTSVLDDYASSCVIENNNITSSGGSILVHSGDQVIIRGNNSEHNGVALADGSIDLRGDWTPLRAPQVEDNFMSAGGSAGPNVINIDNCLWAKVVRNTVGRGIGGLVSINITANSQNAIIEQNVPSSILDYNTDFVVDAGVNTSVWGKYSVGVGGFDGTDVSQPSAGNAATLAANLGIGNNGTFALEVSNFVTTWTEGWATVQSDIQPQDRVISLQAPYAGATSTNRNSGGITWQIAAPVAGGVPGIFAAKIGPSTRLQLGGGGSAVFASESGQTTIIGDVDNSSVVEIVPGTGLRLIGWASVVKIDEFETTAKWSQDNVVGDVRDTQPLRFIAQGPDVGTSTGSHKDVQGMQFILPDPGTTGGVGSKGTFDFFTDAGGTLVLRADGDTGNLVVSGEVIAAQFGAQGFDNFTTDQSLTATSFTDLLTVTATYVDGFLDIDFTCCATTLVTSAIFQITLDGTKITGSGTNIGAAVGFALQVACKLRTAIAAGSHTVKVQYKVGGGGTLQIRPATQDEHASLFVRQS